MITARLIPTDKQARDSRRRIFVDPETGIGFDLPENFRIPQFRFVGRAESDRRRVIVEDDQGLRWDVRPEIAKELCRR